MSSSALWIVTHFILCSILKWFSAKVLFIFKLGCFVQGGDVCNSILIWFLPAWYGLSFSTKPSWKTAAIWNKFLLNHTPIQYMQITPKSFQSFKARFFNVDKTELRFILLKRSYLIIWTYTEILVTNEIAEWSAFLWINVSSWCQDDVYNILAFSFSSLEKCWQMGV